MPAVIATKGRTILKPGRAEIPIDEDKMTSEFVKNSKHSQEMIAKREARYKDPGATNMWDFLL